MLEEEDQKKNTEIKSVVCDVFDRVFCSMSNNI